MPEWLVQALLIASGFGACGAPVMIYILDRNHKANVSTLGAIHDGVKHIDECVDDLKQRVSRVEGHLGAGEGTWTSRHRPQGAR